MSKVLITSNLAFPHAGGIENSIRHLAIEAQKVGDEVMVVSSDIPSENQVGDNAFEVPYSEKKYKSYLKVPQPFRFLISFVSAVRTYRRVKKEFSPDFVIARFHFNVVAAWLAGLAPVIFVIPGIVKYQCSSTNLRSFSSFRGALIFYLYRVTEWLALSVSHYVVVFSQNMRKQVLSVKAGIDILQAKPGVDSRRFEAGRSVLSAEQVHLLFVGRLVSAKGLNYAILALKYLPASYILTIVGTGEDEKSLKELVQCHKLDARVCFVGNHNEPELFYSKSHLFLMTSTYEPFGQTIIEASVSGVPVVAFEEGMSVQTATREILGEFGTYAEHLSEVSLAQAIEEAYDRFYVNHEISHKEMTQHIKENFSWGKLYSKLKGVGCENTISSK